MARDVHVMSQVEAVGSEALNARVEVQLATPEPLRFVDEPFEQSLAVSVRAMSVVGHQIIDVQKAPPGEILEDAISGDSDWLALVLAYTSL